MKSLIAIVILIILFVVVAVCCSKTEAISLEVQNMDIVQLAYVAYNEGDWSSFADLHSPGYVQHAPDYKDPIPWSDYELSCRVAHNRLPKLKYRILDIFAFKDRVAVRSVWEFHGGRRFVMRSCPDGIVKGTSISISLIKGGKIIEEWYEYDTVGIQKFINATKYLEHNK